MGPVATGELVGQLVIVQARWMLHVDRVGWQCCPDLGKFRWQLSVEAKIEVLCWAEVLSRRLQPWCLALASEKRSMSTSQE